MCAPNYAPVHLSISTPGVLALQGAVLQSAQLAAQQVEFYHNNIIRTLHVDLAQPECALRVHDRGHLITQHLKMDQGTVYNDGWLSAFPQHALKLEVPTMTVGASAIITARNGITGHLTTLTNHGRITSSQGYDLDVEQLTNTQAARFTGGGSLRVRRGSNRGTFGADGLKLTVAGQFNNLGTVNLQHLDGPGAFDNQGTLMGIGSPNQPMIIDINSFNNQQQPLLPNSGQVIADYLTFGDKLRSWLHQSGTITVLEHLNIMGKDLPIDAPAVCKSDMHVGLLTITRSQFNIFGRVKAKRLQHSGQKLLIHTAGQLDVAEDATFDGAITSYGRL